MLNSDYEKIKAAHDKLFNKMTFKSIDDLAEENIDNNIDLVDKYNKILSQTVKLSKELDIDNSLELSILYTYLLWNGYFSMNKNLFYDSNMRKQIIGLYPLNIMHGNGVCLNFSYMLKDFLRMSGFGSAVLYAKVEDGLIHSYRPNINRPVSKIKLNTIILRKIFSPPKNSPNHAFTLIKENNKYYVYDPTNICMFNVESTKKVNLLGGNGSADIYLKISDIGAFNPPEKVFIRSFEPIKSFNPAYSESEYISSWKNGIELLGKNEKLIEDYYDTTKEDICYIAKNLRKTK